MTGLRIENLGWYIKSIWLTNDNFIGTPQARRIHMLKYIGKELTKRGVNVPEEVTNGRFHKTEI